MRGQDDRPVNPNWVRKSYGAETTFETDIADSQECGCTLTLKVKYADFEQVTRSRTLGFPFLHTADVVPHLMDLLRRTELGERRVRLLGVSFSSLGALSIRPRGQLDLFDPSPPCVRIVVASTESLK